MAIILPKYIALTPLSWVNLYVEYISVKGNEHRRIKVSGTSIGNDNTFTKFEVVQTSRPNMIHLQSSYNNKFLRCSETNPNVGVMAIESDEIEDDQSKSSCTLLRFEYNAGTNSLRLWAVFNNREHALGVHSSDRSIRPLSMADIFRIVDLTTLVILPKHVSFKGDNDLYLRSINIRNNNRLKFEESNEFDPTVHFEATTLNNGDVQLRSTTFNRQLWRKQNPEWIVCDTTDANDRNTMFRAIRLSTQDNSIALLNLANNKYCMRWTRGGQPKLVQSLTASATSVEPRAVLIWQDGIRDRQIDNIQYRLDEARVYNVGPIRTVPQTVSNFSYTETQVTRLGFTYERITRETFSSSHSWKVSYNAEVNVTIIPVLLEGSVQLHAQYEGNVTWSRMNEERETVTSHVDARVPPRTRTTVTAVVGRGSIDVPYSYTQRDFLLNSTTPEVNHFTDGLFTGLNTEIFDYQVTEENLPGNNNSLSSFDEDKKNIRHFIVKPERAARGLVFPLNEDEGVKEVVEAIEPVPSKL